MSRGVKVRVLDAGPAAETGAGGAGLVAELVADPMAAGIARWARQRRLTATGLIGVSVGLGLVAAIWFSEPKPLPKAAAVIALLASFLAARAGRVLVAGAASPAVEWLSAAGWTAVEYAAYAGLAASAGLGGAAYGSAGGGVAGVWRLAVAAMLLQSLRRMTALCADRASGTPDRWLVRLRSAAARRVMRSLALPAGERTLLVALLGAAAGPRLTFLVLLGWGALAFGYLLVERSVGGRGRTVDGAVAAGGGLAAYRDDGPLSRWLGRLVEGRLPPLPPVLVGVLVAVALATIGMGNLTGILALTPVETVLLGGLGCCHAHDGKLDWLVPPLLQTGEYVFIAALGFTRAVPAPLVYTVLALAALRHLDVAYRARLRLVWPVRRTGRGNDRVRDRGRDEIRASGPGEEGYRAGGEELGLSRGDAGDADRIGGMDGTRRLGLLGRLARLSLLGRRAWLGFLGRVSRRLGVAAAPIVAFVAGVGHGIRGVWQVLAGRAAASGPRKPSGQAESRRRGGGSPFRPPGEVPGEANWAGLGWDLRMLIAGLAGAFGVVTFACAALSGYLWVLLGWDFVTGWLGAAQQAGVGAGAGVHQEADVGQGGGR